MAVQHPVRFCRTIDVTVEWPDFWPLTSAVGDERSVVLRMRLHHATLCLMYSLQAHFNAAHVTLTKTICFTGRSSCFCVWHQEHGRSFKGWCLFKDVFICRLAGDSWVTGVQGLCGGDWCAYVWRPDRPCDHVLNHDLWFLPHRCPPGHPANSCPMCRSDPESLMLSCPHPSPYNTHWTPPSFTHQLTLVNLAEGR